MDFLNQNEDFHGCWWQSRSYLPETSKTMVPYVSIPMRSTSSVGAITPADVMGLTGLSLTSANGLLDITSNPNYFPSQHIYRHRYKATSNLLVP
mgnify:CR=1 FL=1